MAAAQIDAARAREAAATAELVSAAGASIELLARRAADEEAAVARGREQVRGPTDLLGKGAAVCGAPPDGSIAERAVRKMFGPLWRTVWMGDREYSQLQESTFQWHNVANHLDIVVHTIGFTRLVFAVFR